MAQTWSLQDVYFRMTSLAWSVATKDKPSLPWQSCSRSPLLCDRLRWHWDISAFISIMQYFWFPIAFFSFLDWLFGGRCTLFPTILFSSLFQLGVYELGDHFCSLFGLFAFGSCGTKQTVTCLGMHQAPCITCWIESKCSFLGGWRRQMLLLSEIIIVGGRAHCLVWTSANVLMLWCFFCLTPLYNFRSSPWYTLYWDDYLFFYIYIPF
jgi:hypothetical protein